MVSLSTGYDCAEFKPNDMDVRKCKEFLSTVAHPPIDDYLIMLCTDSICGETNNLHIVSDKDEYASAKLYDILSRAFGGYCSHIPNLTDVKHVRGERLLLVNDKSINVISSGVVSTIFHPIHTNRYPIPSIIYVSQHGNKPRIDNANRGIDRRLNVVPLSYVTQSIMHKVNIQAFMWMILHRGEEDVPVPASVTLKTHELILHNNAMLQFLKSMVKRDKTKKLSSYQLYLVYKRWAEVGGYTNIHRYDDFRDQLRMYGYKVCKGKVHGIQFIRPITPFLKVDRKYFELCPVYINFPDSDSDNDDDPNPFKHDMPLEGLRKI